MRTTKLGLGCKWSYCIYPLYSREWRWDPNKAFSKASKVTSAIDQRHLDLRKNRGWKLATNIIILIFSSWDCEIICRKKRLDWAFPNKIGNFSTYPYPSRIIAGMKGSYS